MENWIIYLLKTSIWIAVFWGIYRFFLRNELFFKFNRVFLLSGLALSFIPALCRFTYIVNIDLQPVVSLSAIINTGFESDSQPFNWKETVIPGIYVTGVVFLTCYHLIGLYRISRMIRKNSHSSDSHIIEIQGLQSSFSLFGYVFTDMRSAMSDMEKDLILEHEQAHILQKHWIDVVLAQAVCTLLWFNPFAWLYLTAVKQNHEFLADRFVLDRGHSRAVYNAALINSAFKTSIFTFTNSFTYNKLKRIAMMKKINSNPTRKWAVLLIVPALAVFMTAFAKPEYRYSVAQTDIIQPVDEEKKNVETIETVNQDDRKATDASVITPKKQAKQIEHKPDTVSYEDLRKSAKDENVLVGRLLDIDEEKPIAGASIMIEGTTSGTVSDMDGNFVIKMPSGGYTLVISMPGKETQKIEINENNTNLMVLMGKENESVEMIQTEQLSMQISQEKRDIEALPLIIIDGKETPNANIKKLNPLDIESITVLKDTVVTCSSGEKGYNGVVIITTKKKSGTGE
ncbi:MAG: carboxypeptidase-like regulatory domain-containing protein [Tannerella sp.]|jgi:hypothetical protein|nr:carboxypeptidase-like regulatory domain-containing protein [Tannerella sp.]